MFADGKLRVPNKIPMPASPPASLIDAMPTPPALKTCKWEEETCSQQAGEAQAPRVYLPDSVFTTWADNEKFKDEFEALIKHGCTTLHQDDLKAKVKPAAPPPVNGGSSGNPTPTQPQEPLAADVVDAASVANALGTYAIALPNKASITAELHVGEKCILANRIAD
eukprot:6476446-Amphidinium_carterae.3